MRCRPACLRRLRTASPLLLLLAALAPAARATVVYEYTGNPFTVVQAPYTTSDFVSGTLTLPSALAPNMPLTDISPNVLAFSFSDGINTLSDTNLALFFSPTGQPYGLLATDPAGAITNWEIGFTSGPSNQKVIVTLNLPPNLDEGAIDASLGGFGYNINQPGTWTLVPEPSSVVLMGLGLAGLARLGSRRG